MKRTVTRRQPKTKLLEEQSQKLKQKLHNLKQQISAKKLEKKTTKGIFQSSNQASNETKQLSNSTVQQGSGSKPEVSCFLDNLEPIYDKLQSKGITNLQELLHIKEEEIDKWKDIGIGYRIKLKNYLRKQAQDPSKTCSPARPSQNLISVDETRSRTRLIEEIVKTRKQEQIFVPIQRRKDSEDYQEQIGQEEQQIMIKSLYKVFRGQRQTRNGYSASIGKTQVQYSSQDQNEGTIEEIQYEQPGKSVKDVGNIKEREFQPRQLPEYKYCWLCLRKLQQPFESVGSGRHFCSNSCLSKYKESSQIPQNSGFYSQIADTEDIFNEFLRQRQQQNLKTPTNTAAAELPSLVVQDEQIDLSIL